MEKDIWKSRLVVENPQVKVHRLSASTEQKSFGFDSSNQLDRMKDLLKSEPKKKGLLTGGVTFNNIPPLSAVKTEYSDQEKLYNDRKGYTAGETMNMRITDFGNVVPVHNYERKKYNALKGKDFELEKDFNFFNFIREKNNKFNQISLKYLVLYLCHLGRQFTNDWRNTKIVN